MKDPREHPKEIGRLGHDAVFGEVSLYTEEPRTATVTITSKTAHVLKITREVYKNIMTTNNHISNEVRIQIASEALRVHPMLQSLTTAAREKVMSNTVAVKKNKGEYVCKQGSLSNGFYIVTEGVCGISINTSRDEQEGPSLRSANTSHSNSSSAAPTPKQASKPSSSSFNNATSTKYVETVLERRLYPGDVFGENCMHSRNDEARCNANIFAQEPVWLMVIDRKTMLSVRNAKIKDAMLNIQSKYEQNFKQGTRKESAVVDSAHNQKRLIAMNSKCRRISGFDFSGHVHAPRVNNVAKRMARFMTESLCLTAYSRLYKDVMLDVGKSDMYGGHIITLFGVPPGTTDNAVGLPATALTLPSTGLSITASSNVYMYNPLDSSTHANKPAGHHGNFNDDHRFSQAHQGVDVVGAWGTSGSGSDCPSTDGQDVFSSTGLSGGVSGVSGGGGGSTTRSAVTTTSSLLSTGGIAEGVTPVPGPVLSGLPTPMRALSRQTSRKDISNPGPGIAPGMLSRGVSSRMLGGLSRMSSRKDLSRSPSRTHSAHMRDLTEHEPDPLQEHHSEIGVATTIIPCSTEDEAEHQARQKEAADKTKTLTVETNSFGFDRRAIITDMQCMVMDILLHVPPVERSYDDIRLIFAIMCQRSYVRDYLCNFSMNGAYQQSTQGHHHGRRPWTIPQYLELCKNLGGLQVDPMATIFEYDNAGTCSYLILKGAVRIFTEEIDRRSGRRLVIYQEDLAPGDIFGETALESMNYRSVTALAITNCDLVVVEAANYRRALQFNGVDTIETSTDEKIKLLDNIHLLNCLSAHDRLTVARLLTHQSFNRGHRVVKKGERMKSLCFVKEGVVNIIGKKKINLDKSAHCGAKELNGDSCTFIKEVPNVITTLQQYSYYGESGILSKWRESQFGKKRNQQQQQQSNNSTAAVDVAPPVNSLVERFDAVAHTSLEVLELSEEHFNLLPESVLLALQKGFNESNGWRNLRRNQFHAERMNTVTFQKIIAADKDKERMVQQLGGINKADATLNRILRDSGSHESIVEPHDTPIPSRPLSAFLPILKTIESVDGPLTDHKQSHHCHDDHANDNDLFIFNDDETFATSESMLFDHDRGSTTSVPTTLQMIGSTNNILFEPPSPAAAAAATATAGLVAEDNNLSVDEQTLNAAYREFPSLRPDANADDATDIDADDDRDDFTRVIGGEEENKDCNEETDMDYGDSAGSNFVVNAAGVKTGVAGSSGFMDDCSVLTDTLSRAASPARINNNTVAGAIGASMYRAPRRQSPTIAHKSNLRNPSPTLMYHDSLVITGTSALTAHGTLDSAPALSHNTAAGAEIKVEATDTDTAAGNSLDDTDTDSQHLPLNAQNIMRLEEEQTTGRRRQQKQKQDDTVSISDSITTTGAGALSPVKGVVGSPLLKDSLEEISEESSSTAAVDRLGIIQSIASDLDRVSSDDHENASRLINNSEHCTSIATKKSAVCGDAGSITTADTSAIGGHSVSSGSTHMPVFRQSLLPGVKDFNAPRAAQHYDFQDCKVLMGHQDMLKTADVSTIMSTTQLMRCSDQHETHTPIVPNPHLVPPIGGRLLSMHTISGATMSQSTSSLGFTRPGTTGRLGVGTDMGLSVARLDRAASINDNDNDHGVTTMSRPSTSGYGLPFANVSGGGGGRGSGFVASGIVDAMNATDAMGGGGGVTDSINSMAGNWSGSSGNSVSSSLDTNYNLGYSGAAKLKTLEAERLRKVQNIPQAMTSMFNPLVMHASCKTELERRALNRTLNKSNPYGKTNLPVNSAFMKHYQKQQEAAAQAERMKKTKAQKLQRKKEQASRVSSRQMSQANLFNTVTRQNSFDIVPWAGSGGDNFISSFKREPPTFISTSANSTIESNIEEYVRSRSRSVSPAVIGDNSSDIDTLPSIHFPNTNSANHGSGYVAGRGRKASSSSSLTDSCSGVVAGGLRASSEDFDLDLGEGESRGRSEIGGGRLRFDSHASSIGNSVHDSSSSGLATARSQHSHGHSRGRANSDRSLEMNNDNGDSEHANGASCARPYTTGNV